MSRPVLIVADGMNFLHRGYWATKSRNMTDRDGNPVGAIHGFFAILMADFRNQKATHCAVIFDRSGKNFRHALLPTYKGTRPKTDPELTQQLLPIKRMLTAAGIRVYGIHGEEGDDLIGSVATTVYNTSKRAKILIASNDKDFGSLVSDRIHLLKPKNNVLDRDGVYEQYGVYPEHMVEYLMLLGDKVDAIPGVAKVGPVTASSVLNEYGSIRSWLKNGKKSAALTRARSVKDQFRLTKKLITIKTDCLPNVRLEKLELGNGYDEKAFKRMCMSNQLRSTYNQVSSFMRALSKC